MLAFAALVAPLLATSVHALTLQPRGAPTEAPGAVGFQFPPLRGWAQGAASESPCGGFVRQGTTDYPMSGGDVLLKLLRDTYNIQVSYGIGNPTSNDAFQPLVPMVDYAYSGSQCFRAPDFAALGANVGDTVTLQVTGETGPKRTAVYQCADITLVDNYVQTETYTCANVTASTQTRGNQQSSGVSESVASATAAVAATGKLAGEDQPVSPVGAGFIGAAVALVLCAVVVAGAYFAGVAKFGSRSKLAAASAAHHQDTIPAYAQDNGSMISRGSMVKA
ncbi:hypothetical protein DMC30DRAFT_427887 [Rhodotorula diobovata]|uniref:Copper acquisition factor BIM1-like domain-containing protein n=1 Tax=Rhodotorula diobovata TaxID=5288 RepID=A0A5C5FPB1_9BASI|nr:hypothetical protein DMC30DRAFT_427887 [Rhodotorula diobovata]